MNFWNKLKDWFKEEEQSSPTKPFMEEWLERSEQEKEDLQKWKLSENCLKFCDLVYGAFLVQVWILVLALVYFLLLVFWLAVRYHHLVLNQFHPNSLKSPLVLEVDLRKKTMV